MESFLLFFLIGLTIFGVKYITKDQSNSIQFIAFAAGGALSGALIGFLGGSSLFPIFRIPWGVLPVIGAMAGLLLYSADKSGLIHKPGIQYIVTVVLASVLAGLSYGIVFVYRMIVIEPQPIAQPRNIVLLSYLLIGFLTVFGFTFPERWFKRREG
jgi:hypothetical protein